MVNRLLITAATLLAVPAFAQTDVQTDLQADISAESLALTCPEGRIITLDNRPACELEDNIQRLIADFERNALQGDVYAAGERGDREALRRLPDVSPEGIAQRQAYLDAFIRRHTDLRRAPSFARLTQNERLDYDLLGFVLSLNARVAPFDEARIPFQNDSGFFNELLYVVRQTQFDSAADYRDYAARLTKLPAYFSAHKSNMRRGIETEYTASADIMPGIIDVVRRLAEAPVADHPLFEPFTRIPEDIPATSRQSLKALGEAAVTTSVIPAYQTLLAFLEEEYAPAARTEPGVGTTEQGRDYYRALVRNYTTLDLSPDEVHALGQSEVARIRSEMDEAMREAEFTGTFAEFLEFLRTDPQFYAKTEEELLMRAAWLAKRLDGQMPAFFKTLPRLPYGVIKVPDEIAPNYTTGRYWGGSPENRRAGNYVVNTYDLSQRPLYELPALTAHEGVPGHHHQIALGQELNATRPDMPEFRRSLYPTAFGEGWGLYAEKLAAEMGLYQTPYERFGQLSYEMWRACRLVVDTGMHWLGWSREQAESCFLENSALSRSNIRTEVDRYISWPGQALAYKVGELKIIELRDRAEAALGDKFDIGEFHDAVLMQGGVPLSQLERQIDQYIARVQRAP
jgi:uncharacterized protein (DUF885 family)